MKKSPKDFDIIIMGETWEIKFGHPVINDGENVAGLCDYNSNTIMVDASQDDEMVICTLFHEIFHAYVRRAGIYNGNLSKDMEEIIADQFGTVIAENFDFKL